MSELFYVLVAFLPWIVSLIVSQEKYDNDPRRDPAATIVLSVGLMLTTIGQGLLIGSQDAVIVSPVRSGLLDIAFLGLMALGSYGLVWGVCGLEKAEREMYKANQDE